MSDLQLATLDRVLAQIELASSPREACELRDRAEAVRVYTKRQENGAEIGRRAAEIKLRAERKLGQLLPAQPRGRGKISGRNLFPPVEACRFRKVAAIEREDFEGYLGAMRSRLREPTVAGALRYGVDLEPAVPLEKASGAASRLLRTIREISQENADMGEAEELALSLYRELRRQLDRQTLVGRI